MFLIFTANLAAQDEVRLFSNVIKKNIRKLNNETSNAYANGDIEKGKYIFDTLINNQIIGSRFEDYAFRKVNGGKLNLSSFKKPILLQTYTSWCVINNGEIQALNKLAKKHRKDIQIIVVFWDKKRDAKKFINQFSWAIEVCYATESSYKDEEVVNSLKYGMGFLASYCLDEKLNLVSLKIVPPKQPKAKTPLKEKIKWNYEIYENNITDLLLKSNSDKKMLTKN